MLTYYTHKGDLFDPAAQRDTDSLYSGAGGSLGGGGQNLSCSPIKESSSEPALITTEELPELGERKMSASHLEHVHDLVAEAMLDADFGRNKKASKTNSGTPHHRKDFGAGEVSQQPRPVYDLHFAPDFGDVFQCKDTDFYQNDDSARSTPLPSMPIMESSNGLPIDIQPSDEDEEEFCILENDPGVGIIVRFHKCVASH